MPENGNDTADQPRPHTLTPEFLCQFFDSPFRSSAIGGRVGGLVLRVGLVNLDVPREQPDLGETNDLLLSATQVSNSGTKAS